MNDRDPPMWAVTGGRGKDDVVAILYLPGDARSTVQQNAHAGQEKAQ
jgi:hypothetical protein